MSRAAANLTSPAQLTSLAPLASGEPVAFKLNNFVAMMLTETLAFGNRNVIQKSAVTLQEPLRLMLSARPGKLAAL